MKKNTKGVGVNRSDLWISAKVIRTGFDKEPAAGGLDEATKQQMVRFFSQYRTNAPIIISFTMQAKDLIRKSPAIKSKT